MARRPSSVGSSWIPRRSLGTGTRRSRLLCASPSTNEVNVGRLTPTWIAKSLARCGLLAMQTSRRYWALIAWERLDAQSRAAVVEILKQHVRFNDDFENEMPHKIRNSSAAIIDMWIFGTCRNVA